MNVLAINCGSSSLKFDLIETAENGSTLAGKRIAQGLVDGIGRAGTVSFQAPGRTPANEAASIPDHAAAVKRLFNTLDSSGVLNNNRIDAAGHRVVHGGDHFMEPALVNGQVIAAIEEVTKLAPLHNGPALAAIAATREELGHDTPMVATFDTTFHRSIPEYASRYAIPVELADQYHIRRYGFHGLAHRYMTEAYADTIEADHALTRLITLQLGNGCSATAIRGGQSVETSMGFTPLEGLMMGTRSGDVDPSLAGFIAMNTDCSIAQAEQLLNTRSGLAGVSGRSSDMRTLLAAEAEGDTRAALAIDMFCYRVRKYLGAYLAVLGGADAVIFGGGIGENAAAVRERICEKMQWCGLDLDPVLNTSTKGGRRRISGEGSAISVYVVPVDEALIIAADTDACVARESGRLNEHAGHE